MTHAKHGSPADRGRSDYYYGRRLDPHKWLDLLGAKRVTALTETETNEYLDAYCDPDNERKDWR